MYDYGMCEVRWGPWLPITPLPSGLSMLEKLTIATPPILSRRLTQQIKTSAHQVNTRSHTRYFAISRRVHHGGSSRGVSE